MSDENNSYGSNDDRYTKAPDLMPNYSGGSSDYGSGKGQGTGLGIASMVCGIVSLVGCCGLWYVSLPCAVVAIVLGIVQIVKNESRGMAIAGIICGGVGIVLTVLVIVGVMAFLSSDMYMDLLREAGYELN